MWEYALRRLLMTVPILLGITIICFALVQIAPGDPVQALLPTNASPEDIAAMKALYGLDKPLVIQYLSWLARAVTGDLGISIGNNSPVTGQVFKALGNTFTIAVIAVVIAFILSTVMGVMSAARKGGVLDRVLTAVAVFGISVPSFWLAVVLVILFAVNLQWLPAMGMGRNGSDNFSWVSWGDLKYAILPIFALTLAPLGVMMRTTRASVADALSEDFVETLRAKGLSETQVTAHALRNSMPSIVAMLGLQLGYMIGGSVLVETVFNWPGTGFLLNQAIMTRDIPLLQGSILVLATGFVLINLIVDLLQTIIDPRIKRG